MAITSNATTLRNEDVFNPQVLSDMISAELEHAIALAPLATVGTRLEGRAGNTITMPKWGYIGDAEDVAEGEDITIKKMSHTVTSVTVKKAGIGVEMTDEAVLSGYGDPAGEAKNQILMSLANKMDNDLLDSLGDSELSINASSIKVSTLLEAKAKFGEKVNQPAVLLVPSTQYIQIASDILNFEHTDKVLIDGAVGKVAGLQVVISDKLTDTEAYIVAAGALGLEYKRRVLVETDRDIVSGSNVITGNVHYVAYLRDASKVVKINISMPS